MAIINFPFQKKEGKYFSPIVSQQTTYKVQAGAVVADSTKIVNGLKGAYATVRLTLPVASASSYAELYAINSVAVYSSQ
jgi:hypothetical protein